MHTRSCAIAFAQLKQGAHPHPCTASRYRVVSGVALPLLLVTSVHLCHSICAPWQRKPQRGRWALWAEQACMPCHLSWALPLVGLQGPVIWAQADLGPRLNKPCFRPGLGLHRFSLKLCALGSAVVTCCALGLAAVTSWCSRLGLHRCFIAVPCPRPRLLHYQVPRPRPRRIAPIQGCPVALSLSRVAGGPWRRVPVRLPERSARPGRPMRGHRERLAGPQEAGAAQGRPAWYEA